MSPDPRFEALGAIGGVHHRLTFYRAEWTGPDGESRAAVVRDHGLLIDGDWVEVSGAAQRLDEQWVVVHGDAHLLDGGSYYTAGEVFRPKADALEIVSPTRARLRLPVPDGSVLIVEWECGGARPVATWELTAARDGGYVVGYQSLRAWSEDEVDEVLCGAQQHARVIGSPSAIKAWELFAPMSLVQTEVDGVLVTSGVYVPAAVMAFEHERFLGNTDQPFAMSLRNDDWGVQPTVFAPPGGRRSRVRAGDRLTYSFGVSAAAASLYEEYTALARDEFGLDRYRRNVYGTSLTETAHNILDLIAIDPEEDDSVEYRPTVSGWWSRAKAFVDIEVDQTTRTAAAALALGASRVLSRPEDARSFWDRRARPMIENTLSRQHVAYSPIEGFTQHAPLGGHIGDIATLAPVLAQLQHASGGVHEIAMAALRSGDVARSRSPINRPLAAYLLTGDPAWLAHAVEVARWYAREQIAKPYVTNEGTSAFGTLYVKAWLELFVLYELTGEGELLDAAAAEARRYISMFEVRPVPEGQVSTPVGEPVDDMYYHWSTGAGIAEYPRSVPHPETVDRWMVSTTGLTFEQLSTFLKTPGGGFTLNPIWAPFLLRLAAAADDSFIRDQTHNMVVGRFTNYPGYYHRQFVSAPMRPDYPLVGPPGTSSIYYHHAPPQLALTIDYLLSEHEVRSGGRIRFPSAFEVVFLYFRYRTYGHEPGTFYDDDGVWPYFPRGAVVVEDAQINWLSGVSHDAFHLSLTNVTSEPRQVMVRFDPALTGIDAATSYRAEVRYDNGETVAVDVVGGSVELAVSGYGITAVTVRGAGVMQPWHRRPAAPDRSGVSHTVQELTGSDAEPGQLRAISLPRPDGSGFDVYVQTNLLARHRVALRYHIDSDPWQVEVTKPHPYEWTIPVDDLGATFTFQVVVDGVAADERMVRLPFAVAGTVPSGAILSGDLLVPASVAPGSEIDVTALVGSGEVVEGVTLDLGSLPGWSVRLIEELPSRIEPGAPARGRIGLTPPPDAEAGVVELAARVRWVGGEMELTPGSTTVFAAVELVEARLDPPRLPRPGEPTTLTLALINRSEQTRRGTAVVGLPWGGDAGSHDWEIAPRSLGAVEITIGTAGAPPGVADLDVQPGGDVAPTTVAMRIGDPRDIVIGPEDEGYIELGTWLTQGPDGPDGTPTHYSLRGIHGAQVQWHPTIEIEGRYEIAVWYLPDAEGASAAPYEIRVGDCGGGGDLVNVDQRAPIDGWRVLGERDLRAGEAVALVLTATTDDFTYAHSARFRLR